MSVVPSNSNRRKDIYLRKPAESPLNKSKWPRISVMEWH